MAGSSRVLETVAKETSVVVLKESNAETVEKEKDFEEPFSKKHISLKYVNLNILFLLIVL